MDKQELKNRTQQFAIDIIHFVDKTPKSLTTYEITKQLMRAAFSVGANYRAACRAQSYVHFISKLGTVEEESDECIYWLELLLKSGKTKSEPIKPLIQEANELTAIFTSARITSKQNLKSKNPKLK